MVCCEKSEIYNETKNGVKKKGFDIDKISSFLFFFFVLLLLALQKEFY